MMKFYITPAILLVFLTIISCSSHQPADLILLNGKIITVDHDFSIAEAVAISNERITAVGKNRKIKNLADSETKIIDLEGKTVIPGIIESHMHPIGAAFSELEEKIPDIRKLDELLEWISDQASVKNKGEWIIHPKFFSTRVRELRQPTLEELDNVAPDNPVFLNGSYAGMINSEAIRQSSIASRMDHPGIVTDEKTGKPSGFIKASAFRLLEIPRGRQLSHQERIEALQAMLKRYNRYGITSIFSASGSYESLEIFRDMHEMGILTTRVFQNISFRLRGEVTKENVDAAMEKYQKVTGYGDEWLRIGQLKVSLDGGILTGTAYLREPWGPKAGIYFGIDDPDYRGILNYTHEDLEIIVSAACEHGWSFTAHCTGGGGVDILLDVFERINQNHPVRDKRFSIIHGNFFTDESIERMKNLDIYANMQPAWFEKDADAMQYILGEERIRTFHPYRSLLDAGVMVNGGSDHMVKWDANTAINPYNPFVAMWTVITRTTERGTVINPSEAITREEALKMYTINNAWASFEESIKGSIEPGKLADMVVLSDDFLSCPVDNIRDIESVMTILGGKIVYEPGL